MNTEGNFAEQNCSIIRPDEKETDHVIHHTLTHSQLLVEIRK
jgi:hypothetical protein